MLSSKAGNLQAHVPPQQHLKREQPWHTFFSTKAPISDRGSDNQRIGQKIMIFSKGGLRQRKKLAQWPLAGARR